MGKKLRSYTIGIDAGTNSVGWAVIDDEYRLAKLKNKDAWGAFIFDDAKTAKDTRLKRAQRRRYERRRERIRLLQELIGDIVLKDDPEFFNRLQESSYVVGEGQYFRQNCYNLFNGDYTDRDFYRDERSRTIYHLRQYLMTADEQVDIRKIYLAIHHIIKYRGNFLYEGKKIDLASGMLNSEINNLFELMATEYDCDLRYIDKTDKLVEIIKDKQIIKKDKKKKIIELFKDADNSAFVKEFANAILGYSTKLSDLILSESPVVDENDKDVTFSFADSKYDEKEESYLVYAGDKEELFSTVKAIYTSILFEDVMQGQKNISLAMIHKFEKHKSDLKLLKRLFRENLTKKEYTMFFRREKGVNYVNYVGTNTKSVHYTKKVSAGEFYDVLKKILAKIPDSEDKEYCLREIENMTFLPKLNDVSNAAIPYQMNEYELSAIIDNQGKYYKELIDRKDKIMSLLTFKRPYYVGPLKGDYSWIKQIIKERVTPWNFYDVVDTDALAEEFILRMTNKCQLCPDEEALPKNSIIYQAYTVLNEINKIRYKGKIIADEWKKDIFDNLCCRKKTVKIKDIISRLKSQYNIDVQDGDLTGFADSDALISTMSSLIEFRKRLGDSFDRENIDTYEQVIRILTIFDDVRIRRRKIESMKAFTPSQIESLIRMKFTKWGRFSRYVLHGLYGTSGKTIIELMYETNRNFNEIIYDESAGFKDKLLAKEDTIDKFEHKHVEELYCSPSVKKGIWNTLKIVEEIEKVAGAKPSRIFIESTMGEEEKKKTDSRLARLSELYGVIKESQYFNDDCYDEIKSRVKERKKIDDDKLYLWLTQLGRCMYTGESITFNTIGECEIDHIVPRSYITDDSFENRVLVKKIENQRKTDTLALNIEVQKRMREFWKFLYDSKLIGSKKYLSLTKTEYTDADREGFINRQLVETSQIVKEMKKLLQLRYPEATIECIKAGMNKQFRRKYARRNKAGFYKLRSLNNFHHAKDAYLTAVLGQFTTVACPMWGQEKMNHYLKYYIENSDIAKDSIKTLVNKRYGIILDLMEYGDMDKFAMDDNGEYLWNSTKYSNIFATMEKNNCLIVKKKLLMAESKFYDETLYGKRSGKKDLMPQKCKGGEPMPAEIYGGYSSVKPAYYAIVEYKKGKGKNIKVKYALEGIPVYIVYKEKRDADAVADYLKAIYGESARLLKKVYKYQKVIVDGQLCYIAGAAELNNATELYVDSKYEKMLYAIEKDDYNELNKHYQIETDNIDNAETMDGGDITAKRDNINYDHLMKEFIEHYNYIIRKRMPLYSKFADKLDEILEKYYSDMTLNDKVGLIKNMLTVANTGAGRFDLDKKYGGGTYGRLARAIYPDEIKYIDDSCTGLYSTLKESIN